MFDCSPAEAEHVLRLASLALSGEKIINVTSTHQDSPYWGKFGVLIYESSPVELLRALLPKDQTAEGLYGALDCLVPRMTAVDMMRDTFDVFISYYSGDADFVRQLQRDLANRNVHVWLDHHEIDIGELAQQQDRRRSYQESFYDRCAVS